MGGNARLVVLNGFIPQSGNSFDILDWGLSIAGGFDHISLPPLPGSLTWNTSQLYITGVLSVVGPGITGDYNSNGVVDAADYTIWRDTLGRTARGWLHDGNGNSQVDAGDYDVWKAHFGQTFGSGLGANVNAAVPEPATARCRRFWRPRARRDDRACVHREFQNSSARDTSQQRTRFDTPDGWVPACSGGRHRIHRTGFQNSSYLTAPRSSCDCRGEVHRSLLRRRASHGTAPASKNNVAGSGTAIW